MGYWREGFIGELEEWLIDGAGFCCCFAGNDL